MTLTNLWNHKVDNVFVRPKAFQQLLTQLALPVRPLTPSPQFLLLGIWRVLASDSFFFADISCSFLLLSRIQWAHFLIYLLLMDIWLFLMCNCCAWDYHEHCKHRNAYKLWQKHLTGTTLQLRGLVHYHHAGSMEGHKQTWCQRGSWEFYIWIFREQEENATLGVFEHP